MLNERYDRTTMDPELKRKAALRKVLSAGAPILDAPSLDLGGAPARAAVARKADLLQQAAPLPHAVGPSSPLYTSAQNPSATPKAQQMLKSAVQKIPSAAPRHTHAQPKGHKINTQAPIKQAFPLEGPWTDLSHVQLGPKRARAHQALLEDRDHPAARSIDMLRTRLLSTLADKGWSRVAITSPTQHCGKGFVATQLALSLSRHDRCRAIVMDLDLRRPSLAHQLGVEEPGDLAQVLNGDRSMQRHLFHAKDPEFNIGGNVAFGLNDMAQRYAAELLMEPRTHAILDKMHERYAPDVTLYNVPPILEYDDMIGFQKQVDAILLVIGGGETQAADLRKVHRIIGSDIPLLGVVLNRAEDIDGGRMQLRSSLRHMWRRVFR